MNGKTDKVLILFLGRNGRPNLTATNSKDFSNRGISKAVGQKSITGPDGTKWVTIVHHVMYRQLDYIGLY